MAVLEIRKYPDKILAQKTLPVKTIDSGLQRLIDDMIATMYDAPGVGLAANQVGVAKRLAVIDISQREPEGSLLVLVNPEFVERTGSVDSEEGCLSLPEYTAKVKRAEKVSVKALDREGKEFVIHGEGLLAMALQHEIDHLDGVLLIDRISPVKRAFFKKRFRKSHKKPGD